jgi:hypothetical protein
MAETSGNVGPGFIRVFPPGYRFGIHWQGLEHSTWRTVPVHQSDDGRNDASLPPLTARHDVCHLKAGHPVVVEIEEKGITGNRLHPPEPTLATDCLATSIGIERWCKMNAAVISVAPVRKAKSTPLNTSLLSTRSHRNHIGFGSMTNWGSKRACSG